MADIRINALATTATTPASDDYLALDGAAQGTRKILATNIANNVTDVILGTSGPSVKSTLSARAPRQGLVFDGSAKIPFSLAAFGTNPATIHFWFNPATLSGNPRLIGASSAIQLLLDASGAQFYTAGGSVYGSALTVGKTTAVTVVINGNGTAVVYTNGVAGTSGNITANLSTAIDTLGGLSSGNIFSGVMSPLIYNRALSASEVVALYEAGAPAGADYPGTPAGVATNTATFQSGGGWTATTLTATSAQGTLDGTSARYFNAKPDIAIRKGQRIQIKYDLAVSGAVPAYKLVTQAGSDTGGASLTVGTNQTAVITAHTTSTTWISFGFADVAGNTITLSNVTITPLGLLLAPDAAQAGGGLVWYDTSGNAANITLPASGVSWNVPTSFSTAGGWTYGSTTPPTLQIANTTSGLAATQTVANNVVLGTLKFGHPSDGQSDKFPSIVGRFDPTDASFARATQLEFYTSSSAGNALGMTLNKNGNFLLGTTSDSGNGKIQLATHTTSAGGIGFGTDTSLFRAASGNLCLNDSGTNAALSFYNAGTLRGYVFAQGSTTKFILGSLTAGWSTEIQSGNGTTALTLDSSQNILTSTNGIIYTNRVYNLTGGATPLTIGWTGSAGVISVFSSGDTTFAGNITRTRSAAGSTGSAVTDYLVRLGNSTSPSAAGVLASNIGLSNFRTSLVLRTTDTSGNAVDAATFDYAGDATFAGATVNVSKAGNNPSFKATDGAVITKLQSQTAGDTTGAIGTESNHTLKLITNNTTRLTIAATGEATFTGAIAIGNTVQTAAAVASTHKVTISIGGSTYYLLATNV